MGREVDQDCDRLVLAVQKAATRTKSSVGPSGPINSSGGIGWRTDRIPFVVRIRRLRASPEVRWLPVARRHGRKASAAVWSDRPMLAASPSYHFLKAGV